VEIFPPLLTKKNISGNISATDVSVADILPEMFSDCNQEI
jgi:hypothetical protein